MKSKGKPARGKKAASVKDLAPSAKAGSRIKGGLRQKKQVTKMKFDKISFDAG
jgi:hypothetical protein